MQLSRIYFMAPLVKGIWGFSLCCVTTVPHEYLGHLCALLRLTLGFLEVELLGQRLETFKLLTHC